MKEKIEKKEPKQYSKEKILNSNKFSKIQKDVLFCLLRDGEKYTLEEAEKKLKKYLGQEAK